MPYATKQDLIDRHGELQLVQLTDRTNIPPTTIDDVVVNRALDDATALADGYVGKAVALPLPSVPPVLTKVCADLARYFLHGSAAEKDGPVERAYKEGLAWLRDVARGAVTLDLGPAAGNQPAPQAGGGQVLAKPSDRVFTRETLKGF